MELKALDDVGVREASRSSERRAPTWPRVAVLLAVIGLTFLVSRSCQQSQIKVSQDEAVATARSQINFRPDSTTIRLLRQGLETQPFWIVVFSSSKGDRLVNLAQVYVDAKTGEVTKVNRQRARDSAKQRSGSGP